MFDVSLGRVLSSIAPGKEWRIVGDQIYENIEWLDDSPMPTFEEIEAGFARYETETMWRNFRSMRNGKLGNSDWTQLPDADVDKVAWAEYRQALRDLPSVTADPMNVTWPNEPA